MTMQAVSLSALEASAANPRRKIDRKTIEGLATSIRTDGLLHNLVVSPVKGKGKSQRYQIVSGARRYHALKLLEDRGELPEDFTVAVEVRDDLSKDQTLRIATVENLQRQNNIVNGRGDVVGAEITTNTDISKISFTGSTAVGKAILRAAAETLKRVTLELGGKSPTVILDDADFAKAIPLALEAGFANSGQACIAGTRILVPASRLDEAIAQTKTAIRKVKVGASRDADTAIGPMVSQAQYERVQRYIRLGIEAGAIVVAGGEGHPDGLGGYFVKPTVFANVTNNMTIAREEIFGPVLCMLTYEDEAEAVAIANDTPYGLQAYVISSNPDRASAVANQIEAGRVVINGAPHDPAVPFGGFKQSGIGREYGVFGLQAYLEPKAILGGIGA